MVKLNARVVLLKNLNTKLVNGLCGTINSFIDGFPCVLFDNGEVEVIREKLFVVEREGIVVASRKQVPLHLAYAITIHKSQGMSFDFLEVDLSRVFEPGQAYVAVSRARTFAGLRIIACRERLPPVCQVVKDFYSSGIVDASKLNVDDVLMCTKKQDTTTLPIIRVDECVPVPSTATESLQFVINQQFSQNKLPTGAMNSIHRRVQKEFKIGDDISEVLKTLKFKENEKKELYSDSDLHIDDFCQWLWCLYEQMHHNDESAIIDRKKLSGITKQLHSLHRSSQLLEKWKEQSVAHVDIGIGGKDRKAAVVYARAVYAEFLNRKADDPRKAYFNSPTEIEKGSVHSMTKEAQGKIRDICGWVISEEIKACITYINHHKSSKSAKVANKVEKNRKIEVILDQFKLNKDDALHTSKYPETLEHITLYDEGGKTYVTDETFDFFIKVTSLASELFSEKNIHAYKQNVLLVAYSHLLNNAALKENFCSLVHNAVDCKLPVRRIEILVMTFHIAKTCLRVQKHMPMKVIPMVC